MITKIVAELNAIAGNHPIAVKFGDGAPPAPPYVVVKQESGNMQCRYRIIAHFAKGQQTYLEDYLRISVGNALDYKKLTDRYGCINVLEPTPEISGTNAISDDGTISMDRVYVMPDLI